MRSYLVKGLYSLLMFGSLFFPSNIVFSNTLNSFDVNIQPPEEQVEKQLRYYDLQLKPSQTITLPVALTNKNETELTLELSFHQATNNSNGTIVYTNSELESAAAAVYNIEDFVNISQKKVTLNAKETKNILVEIKMPDEKFEGVLAGGVYIKEVGSDAFDGNIQNLFARELAILLRSNTQPVAPELKIGKAYSQHVNGRNAIGLHIENLSPTYTETVKFSYTIEKDSDPTAFHGEKEIRLAPNALLDYTISLEGTTFEPGEYKIKTTLVHGEQRWEGSPTFTIENTEAQNLNAADVSIEQPDFPWRLIIIAIVVLLLVVVVLSLIKKNKQLRQALESKNEEK